MNYMKHLAYIMAFLVFLGGCNGAKSDTGAARGAGIGAVGGAVLGLGMGALTGEGKYAAAGAAVGAAAGAAAGGMYMYDQSRDDDRTKMLADAIGGGKKGETPADAGKRHLADFTGDWKLDIWSLDAQGKRVTAFGKATTALTNKDTLTVSYSDIKADGFDQTFSGKSVVSVNGSALALENVFSGAQGDRRFAGEYVPANNLYNFYPSQTADGKTVTGVIRSNIRIEISANGNLAVAKTFSLVDGAEVQIQQYTFTR